LQLGSNLLRPAITAIQIFDELVAHNALRAATLVNYTAFRTYQVVYLNQICPAVALEPTAQFHRPPEDLMAEAVNT
jgi:hypothetical protein